ncbi:MAG: folate-binding protein [Opitutaceae bacterium]|nr:folate-binding protein [Opitutaceae bacterium]
MTIGPNAIHAWHPAAWLGVRGPDAFSFLQGQFTNDLRELDRSPAIYGLWLNQKGRVLADAFVLRGTAPEVYWVGSYFSPAAVIRERLGRYLVADDVIIRDETEAWKGVTLAGPNAMEAARALGDGFVFAGRRGLSGAAEFVARTMPKIPGATGLSADDMERARIRAGIAAVPADIGPAELPNEGGLEATAISYMKGCYLGQEVMSRLKSMGQVRRQLLRVRGVGPSPPRPAKLYQGPKPVGELRSTAPDGAGFIGFALLTMLNLRRDAGLSLAPDAPIALTVTDPS